MLLATLQERVLLPGGAIVTTHNTEILMSASKNNPDGSQGQLIETRSTCDLGDLVLSFL